jgi:hypothetical protein
MKLVQDWHKNERGEWVRTLAYNLFAGTSVVTRTNRVVLRFKGKKFYGYLDDKELEAWRQEGVDVDTFEEFVSSL